MDAQLDDTAVEALKKLTKEQRVLAQQEMLQVLLGDRCKLMTHRETRDLPIYTLVVAKSGPKLQVAKAGELYTSSFSGSGMVKSVTAQAATIARLVQHLEVAVGRPVVDQTGLKEKYDCKVEWTPDDGQPSGDPAAAVPASIFTAIEEQIGLKLVPGKGPVEIIVIDRLEKPVAN